MHAHRHKRHCLLFTGNTEIALLFSLLYMEEDGRKELCKHSDSQQDGGGACHLRTWRCLEWEATGSPVSVCRGKGKPAKWGQGITSYCQ